MRILKWSLLGIALLILAGVCTSCEDERHRYRDDGYDRRHEYYERHDGDRDRHDRDEHHER